MSRELMIPAEDTRLHTVDEPGGAPALLFLSGGFGTVRNWSHVIRRLAGKYRTVRLDARARGKSGRSADYSVQAAVDDIGRVIDTIGLERPILIGWSHGATIAVRYAARHPELVGGLVLIDGAYPIAMFDEAGKQRVRIQFRRLGWIMRIMAALGRSARMSPAESAGVVIEMDAVNGELGPDFATLKCARSALPSWTPWRATSASRYMRQHPTSTRRSSARTLTPWLPRSRTSSTGSA
jgi:pimeloyl-ACP methyl ester carboxylesterase